MNYIIRCIDHSSAEKLMDDFVWTVSVTNELKKVFRKFKTVYTSNGDCYKFLSGPYEAQQKYLQGRENDKQISEEFFRRMLEVFNSKHFNEFIKDFVDGSDE